MLTFEDARATAQARASISGKTWCLYTDSNLNLQICPEAEGPKEVIEVFTPVQWRESPMIERLEALCRDVAKLDDNGPDPHVAEVKEKATALLAKFFPSEGFFFHDYTSPTDKYTVIGFYNTGERYCGHHIGEKWLDAVKAAVVEGTIDLNIVEVIAGHHKGLTECEYVESASCFPRVSEGDSP